jgi:PAS domain-containing protein
MRAEKIARERKEREERERPMSKVSSKPPSSSRRQGSRGSASQEADERAKVAVFEAVRGIMGGMVEDVTQHVVAEKRARADVSAVVASIVDVVVARYEEESRPPPVIPPYPLLLENGEEGDDESESWLVYISDLKDFEDRTSAVVIGFDIEGIINEWNAPAVAVFGRTREEMIGLHLTELDLFEPEDKAAIFEVFDQCRMGNEIPALRINIPVRAEFTQEAVQATQDGEITAHDTNVVQEDATLPAAHDHNVAGDVADATIQDTPMSQESNGVNQDNTVVTDSGTAGGGAHKDGVVVVAGDANKTLDTPAVTEASESGKVQGGDQSTAAGTDEQESRSQEDAQDVNRQTPPVSPVGSAHEGGSGSGSGGGDGSSSSRPGGKRLTGVLYAVTRNDERGTIIGVVGAIGRLGGPDALGAAGPHTDMHSLIDLDPFVPAQRMIVTPQEYMTVERPRSEMAKPSTAKSGSVKSVGSKPTSAHSGSVPGDNEGGEAQEAAAGDVEAVDDRDEEEAKVDSLEPVQESPAEEEDADMPEFAAKPSTPPQPVDSESFGAVAVSRPDGAQVENIESGNKRDDEFDRSFSTPLPQDARSASENYERSHSVPMYSSTQEGEGEGEQGTLQQDFQRGGAGQEQAQGEGEGAGAAEGGEAESAKPSAGEDENTDDMKSGMGMDEQSTDGRSDVHTATASSRSAFMPSRRETSRLGTAASMVLRLASAGRAASARLATGSDMTPTPTPMEMSQIESIESAPSTAHSVAPPRTPAEVGCPSA